jgi:hypothetical protein
MVKDTYLVPHKRKDRSPCKLDLEILERQLRNEFSLCTSINKQDKTIMHTVGCENG